LRVAVVGVGEMGRRHVRVLSSLPAFEVVGVVDTDAVTAADASARWEVPRLEDDVEAIARAQMVVVATPISAHLTTALRALDARRHVLVEKPICARLADAERLVLTARRRGARLFVGHSERFNPVVRALAERLDPREIRAIETCRVGPPVSPRPRTHEGGVLLNLGVHDIDLAAYLARSTARLRRAEGNEARAHIELALASGVTARVRVDRIADVRRRSVRVITEAWTYEGDLLAPRLVRTAKRGGGAEELPLEHEEPLRAQARAALSALRDEGTGIATGAEGTRALAIAEHATTALARAREGTATAAEKL
jgi:predicted dehydrogenase